MVAVQLFLAIKHALELLYGRDAPVPREDVAVISGIRIPCAADVPAYFMGISPSDLQMNRLVHCAQIGPYAVAVVDRRTNRAVKIDTVTGILPRDKELLSLRRTVIAQHSRRASGGPPHPPAQGRRGDRRRSPAPAHRAGLTGWHGVSLV